MSIIDQTPAGYRVTIERKLRDGAKWDENAHPRDRLGRFIETGAEVRIWGGQLARVVGNVGGGRIEVVRADGSHAVVHRNYLTVTKRPDGSAPTTQQAADVAELPEVAEPTKPDAVQVDVPSEPTPGADTVRDQGAALAEAVPDSKLSTDVRDRSAAYHEAVTNNVPDDEADERAALLETLDQVDASGADEDVAALSSQVRSAATAEPAAATPAPAAAPDAPEAPDVPEGPSIGDQLASNEGQTVNLVMANGDTVTGQVVSNDGGNIDIQTPDGTVDRVRETDVERVERATPATSEGTGTISNPDDPNGSPSYEGPLDQAHTRLAPGTYDATDNNGNPVTVAVTDDSSTVSPREAEPTTPGPDTGGEAPAPSAAPDDELVTVQQGRRDPGVPIPPGPPPEPEGTTEDRVRRMQQEAIRQAGLDDRWRIRGNIYTTSIDQLREGDVIYTQGDGSTASPVGLPGTGGGILPPYGRKPRTVARVDRNGNARTIHFTDGTSTGREGGNRSDSQLGGRVSVAAVPGQQQTPDRPAEPERTSAPRTVEEARERLRVFGARLQGARRGTVAERVGLNARGLARARAANLRLSPQGRVIARRSSSGAWVPYAVGNADRLSDASVQFTDDEIDDVLRRYDDLGIPFDDHDAVTARWRDRDQRRTDADALRALGRSIVEARGGRAAVQGASRGRFRDIEAVRRHLRASPNRAVSTAIALDPLAELSSSGRLLIHRDPDGERGYRVATTHAGKRISGRLFGTRAEALAFADQLENNLLDKDGNAYPFDGAIGERRLRTWRNARRESVGQVMAAALRNVEASNPRPEEFNDAWYNQQYTPAVELPDDLTTVSDEELTRLSNVASANSDRASMRRLTDELTRRRREARLSRMNRPLSDAERRMFTGSQANGDQELAERNMRDLFDFTHSNGWKIEWSNVRISDRNSMLHGDIIDTEGRSVGRVARSVIQRSNGEVEVHHDLLAINGNYQGQGFADAFYKTLYDRYRERGIDIVTIDANIDVGGYAWAQRGFGWSGGQMPGMAHTRAIANIDAIDTSRMSDADKERIRQFREDVWDRKFTPKQLANALSDIRWKKTLPSGKEIDMWPGKAAMLGTYWGGEFRVAELDRPDATPRPDRPEATPPPPPPPPAPRNVADMTDEEMRAEMDDLVRQGAMLTDSPLAARRQELLDEAERRRIAARPPVRVSTEAVGGMSHDALNNESTYLSNRIDELMNEQGRDDSDPDVQRVIARQREISTERHRRIEEARNDLIPDGEDVTWTGLKVGDTVVIPFITSRGPEVATISSIEGNELRVRYDDGTEQRYFMFGSMTEARWRRATKPETVGGSETVATRDLKVGDRLLLDDGRTATIDRIGEPSGDRITLEVTDDTGQAREIEADRASSHVRVTGDEPPEVTRPDTADMDEDDLYVEWVANDNAGARDPNHPLHQRQQAVGAELVRRRGERDAEIEREQEAIRRRPVDVEATTEPTARPRLYTYQRKNVVALGLDTPAAGMDPVVQQAAARVRARQPLTAAQSQALADHIRQLAEVPGTRIVRQRSLNRLAAAFDTSATVAAGRRADAPQPGNDRVQRVRGTGLTAGDSAVIRGADGSLVTARVTRSQSMMRGTVARVTYTDDEGNEHTRILDRDSDVWLMPDLPPDKPDPVEELPGRELLYGEDVRVGDTITYLRGGQYYEAQVRSIEQEGDQLHVHFETGADAWMLPGELRTRTARGPESQDQQYLYAVQMLDKPESISANDVEIGDRIVVDLYDPPAQGTVTSVRDVVMESRGSGKRIDFIDDSGANMSVTVFDGMNVQRTARAAENATATIEAISRERARRERQAELTDVLNRLQSTGGARAASRARDIALGSGRDAVLREIDAALIDAAYLPTEDVARLQAGLGTENRPAAMALATQLVVDSMRRVRQSIEDAEQVGDEDETAMLRRVLDQNINTPPLRHNHQVAKALLESVGDLEVTQEQEEVGNLPPRVADKDLPGRMDAYRRALGGQFGHNTTRLATFGRVDLAALERGEAPTVVYSGSFPARDRAEDGGPGERTMRQLEIMRSAGADLDGSLQDRIETRLRASGLNLPPEAEGMTVSAYMGQLADMSKRLELAQREAYNRMLSGPRADQDAARAEFNRLVTERDKVERPLNRLRRPFADAQREAARELIAEIREVGGVHLDYQDRTSGAALPDSDSLVRSMRSAEDVLPTAWITWVRDQMRTRYGRDQVGLGSTDRGYADFNGNIMLSGWGERFTGDPGRGRVAVHELGHFAERAVPGLMAAEAAFLWSRTSTGEVGSRQRDELEHILNQEQFGYTDDFRQRYTGVDYQRHANGSVESYEVLTTGLESLFAGSEYLDDDFRRWLLGALALL